MKYINKSITLCALSILVIVGSAQSQQNKKGSGNALLFDGKDDYVEISTMDLSTVTQATITLWWKPSTDINQSSSTVGLWGYSTDKDNNVRWGWYPSRNLWELRVESGGGSAAKIDHTKHFEKGEWVFCAIVLDENNPPKWYIDGELEVTGTGSGSFSTIGGAYPFVIGQDFQVSSTGSNNTWNGAIDEFRLWGKALSESEIRQLMCQKLSGNESNLIGYWRLDEGSGNTVNDCSPNNNDGTLK